MSPEPTTRAPSQRDRILARLRDGPASNVELAEVGGFRYSARIGELRADGWDIPKPTKRGGGVTVYELRGRVPEERGLFA